MKTETIANSCPKCEAPLPAEAPQGLCPKCLLAAVSAPAEAGQSAQSHSPPPALEAVAAAFPQLEILELIGQGGMGVVYKARQPKLDRFVALKLLTRSLAADAAFAERFNREARVLARLNHPGIVSVFDYGEAGGFYYLLMEYVDGVNLRQAMQAGRFTAPQALALVPKICDALQFAHEEGILHRDIKPENILLDTRGRMKIADFGIAKLVGDHPGDVTLTASGAALGTPHYMAPEQLEHPQEVDQRADIYSLGVVFYEMLTGELPIGRFAPPSEKSAVDARVDAVVFRALEKERDKRFGSAGEVKTRVETIAQNMSPGAPPEAASPGSNRPAGAAPAAGPLAEHAPWSRRAIVAAVLVLCSLVFGIFLTASFLVAVPQSGPAATEGVAGTSVPSARLGILVACLLLLVTAGSALTGTLLGAVALGDLRRAAGRRRGLPFALFAALCWPLLLLDGLLTALLSTLLATLRGGMAPASVLLAAVFATLLVLVLGTVLVILVARWIRGPVQVGGSPAASLPRT